jgi:hypothetical protein
VYCFGCKKTYHDGCWIKKHRRCSDSEDDSDDEFESCPPPTPMRDHILVRILLTSDEEDFRHLQLHIDDVYTKWFGVPYDRSEPKLFIWPRLNYCFRSQPTIPGTSKPKIAILQQYPSVCSFFGETGAGKSTIIKALLCLQQRCSRCEFPVSGNDKNSHISTSGDVHLYPDSGTINELYPLLYAGKISLDPECRSIID